MLPERAIPALLFSTPKKFFAKSTASSPDNIDLCTLSKDDYHAIQLRENTVSTPLELPTNSTESIRRILACAHSVRIVFRYHLEETTYQYLLLRKGQQTCYKFLLELESKKNSLIL